MRGCGKSFRTVLAEGSEDNKVNFGFLGGAMSVDSANDFCGLEVRMLVDVEGRIWDAVDSFFLRARLSNDRKVNWK